MTKAILLDPQTSSIMPTEVDGFEDIQKKIGCRCFTCVRFPDGKHVAYVDDEGLLNGTEYGTMFNDEIYPDPLMGKVLILGTNSAGDDVDCTLKGSELQDMIEGIVRLKH